MIPEIFYTPRYEDDLVRIYKYSARKWKRPVAERTLALIAEVEQSTLADPDLARWTRNIIPRFSAMPLSGTARPFSFIGLARTW